jgi:glutathione S-transferase
LKLYDYKGAPNPRRVQIFLAEKGIDVPLEQVDITKGVNRQSPFLEKNPVGSVPVLELDDGTYISESVSICRYFEALQPEPPLFGSTPLEVATIDMWLRRVELNVMSMVGMVWINDHPLTASLFVQNKPAAEQGRVRAAMGYKLLDNQLASSTFIAGEAYTVVDAVALATIDFAVDLVGVPYGDDLVNLKQWHDLVSSRPSAGAKLGADFSVG